MCVYVCVNIVAIAGAYRASATYTFGKSPACEITVLRTCLIENKFRIEIGETFATRIIRKQAGSRGGSRRAMLRTYA